MKTTSVELIKEAIEIASGVEKRAAQDPKGCQEVLRLTQVHIISNLKAVLRNENN